MEGTLDTNYRRDYVEKEVPVERVGRQYDEYPRLDAPKFDGTTTMQADFKVRRGGKIWQGRCEQRRTRAVGHSNLRALCVHMHRPGDLRWRPLNFAGWQGCAKAQASEAGADGGELV